MNTAYLSVITHDRHPGMLRLRKDAEDPGSADRGSGGPERLRYTARFNDAEAALMHTHALLRRRLVDVDARTYRASLEQAIAVIESLDLRHRRTYMDPDLDAGQRSEIERLTARCKRRRERRTRFVDAVGYLALAYLLFHAVSNMLG